MCEEHDSGAMLIEPVTATGWCPTTRIAIPRRGRDDLLGCEIDSNDHPQAIGLAGLRPLDRTVDPITIGEGDHPMPVCGSSLGNLLG
jgi:hypothetical protein